MVVKRRRKRLRVSSQTTEESQDDVEGVRQVDGQQQVEEVHEFGEDDSSDSSVQLIENVDEPSPPLPKTAAQADEEPGEPTATWVERYSHAQNQTGLAVSTKKFKEIQNWLRQALDYSAPRLLLLSGPPGCGKSSAVRAACKELNCDVSSWMAPVTGSYAVSMRLLDDFQAFVTGVRYASLPCDSDDDIRSDKAPSSRRLLLIEDLPIHITQFKHHRDTLRNIFSSAARIAPHPTVIILSDTEKTISRLTKYMLEPEMLATSLVVSIKVQPVTDVMMKKRLTEVVSMEGLSISRSVLDAVILSSHGDIRSALNSLQFSSVATIIDASSKHVRIRQKSGKKRPRRNQKQASALPEIKQDATLSTYHAISKILNNKPGEGGRSRYITEDLLEESRADPVSFISFLHHNYPSFFGDVNDVVPTLSCLSDADMLLQWQQDESIRVDLGNCAASFVTRGFLLFNLKPVRTGWRPIRGPESYEVARERRDFVEAAQTRLSSVLRPTTFSRSEFLETMPYAKQILQSRGKQVPMALNSRIPMRPSRSPLETLPGATMAFQNQNGFSVPVQDLNSISGGTSLAPNEVEDIEEWDE